MGYRSPRVLATAAAIAAVVTAAAAACSSSGGGSSGASAAGGSGSSAAGKPTITVGLMTDVTGISSSGQKGVEDGFKAGIRVAAAGKYNIKYVVADTASNPTTAQAAARKLVQQQHVSAVIALSSLFFAAAPYFTSQNVPVIGAAEDGPEWITSKNMFSVVGALHTEKVSTTGAEFFKQQGVTSVGALGYSISPTSSDVAKSTVVAANSLGIRTGYLNAKFTFGSTDVGPVALAMKKGGVDGVSLEVDPNTSYALIAELRNQGVKLKAVLLPTGYGADVLQAGPGALKDAQNVYFTTFMQPVAMNTAGTKQFVAALKAGGYTQVPSQPAYFGYASAFMLVQGLDNAKGSTNKAALVAGLQQITSFNPGGLLGAHPLNPTDRDNIVAGPDNCLYISKLVGTDFQLVKGADPVCGTVLPGKTVSD